MFFFTTFTDFLALCNMQVLVDIFAVKWCGDNWIAVLWIQILRLTVCPKCEVTSVMGFLGRGSKLVRILTNDQQEYWKKIVKYFVKILATHFWPPNLKLNNLTDTSMYINLKMPVIATFLIISYISNYWLQIILIGSQRNCS